MLAGRPLSLPDSDAFQAPYAYANSPAMVRRFPYPFASDTYELGVHAEQHDGTGETEAFRALFDIDEHYHQELANRRDVLARDPLRLQVAPHMRQAGWDTLELVTTSLARDFPDRFELTRDGPRWTWRNHLLDAAWTFEFGSADSLGCDPFEFIASQVQGDLVLLDQRDDNLWIDGGMLTQGIGWSLDFSLGMNWGEWHGPVATPRERAIVERGLHMAMALIVDNPIRRVTWSLQATPRLDRAMETLPEWLPEEVALQPRDFGRRLFLRTEFQQLHRLARSNAMLFCIRHYMISMEQLLLVPKWARRLHRVLATLDPGTERYRAMTNRQDVMDWLAPHDDGAPTTPGRGPD